MSQEARFTPTGVGTITSGCATQGSTPVHPHGRGDNIRRVTACSAFGGSPPRAWGQSLVRHLPRFGARFTPTGVGTIAQPELGSVPRTVHPHGRGDNNETAIFAFVNAGSPPRAWGQFERSVIPALKKRFTPTGVGTIYCTPARRPECTVHPHGRGDNVLSVVSQHSIFGSPPRAWGQ